MGVNLSGRNCYPDTSLAPIPACHCVGWYMVVCYDPNGSGEQELWFRSQSLKYVQGQAVWA